MSRRRRSAILTARNAGRLAAVDGRRTDYPDPLLPGLVLRVTARGVRTWVVEYHQVVDGRRRGKRRKLGRLPALDLAAAREKARAALFAIARDGAPPPAEVEVLTVAGLVRRCLADLTLRPTSRAEWERLLEAEIAPTAFGLAAAGLVKRADVKAWARTIATRSGWTANHAFELVRRAYSWGAQEELVDASPCDYLPLPFEGEASARVLSTEELRAVLVAIETTSQPTRDRLKLLLLTMVRLAPVLGMRRDELDGLDGPDPRWIIPGGLAGRSKNRRAHVVPLVTAAVDLVKARLDFFDGELLFPGEKGVALGWSSATVARFKRRVRLILGAWHAARGQAVDYDPDDEKKERPIARMERWKVHGIRHTAATHMREDLGITRDVVELLLSHTARGAAVTRVYDRSELLPERRAALVAWAAWLEDVKAGRVGVRVLPFRGAQNTH